MSLYTRMFFYLIALTPVTFVLSEESTPVIQELPSAQLVHLKEDIVSALLSLCTQIDLTLEHLAQQLSNDKLHNIKPTVQKEMFLKITELRQLFSTIQQQPFIDVTEREIGQIVRIILVTTEYLNNSLEKGFVGLPAFPVDKITVRSRESLEQIVAQIPICQQNIQRLELNASRAGLSKLNKAWLALENLNSRYLLTRKLAVLAGIGGIATLATYLIPTEVIGTNSPESSSNFVIRAIRAFKEKLGETPQYGLSGIPGSGTPGGHIINPEKLKLMGKTHATATALLIDLGLTSKPLITVSIGTVAAGYITSSSSYIKEKLDKWHESILNYLRGRRIQKAQMRWTKEPTKSFNDLIGLEDAKAQLNMLIRYIENPQPFERAGIIPERGYLLAGPPRTGKTALAEALGFELKKALDERGLPSQGKFISISAADILTWQARGEKTSIADLITYAKSQAPCILFIDEIDMLRVQRTGDTRMLADLLTSMSGTLNGNFTSNLHDLVIIVAATNKPEQLDFALRQPGRFGKVIRCELPRFCDRIEYFTRNLQKLGIPTTHFDINQLAVETDGANYDHLSSIIREAFSKAKILAQVVQQSHLIEAIDTVIRQLLPEAKKLPAEELDLIATHIAGQALAHSLLAPPQYPVVCATILPFNYIIDEENSWEGMKRDPNESGIGYGHFWFAVPNDTVMPNDTDRKKTLCMVRRAGSAAEKLLFKTAGNSYRSYYRRSAYGLAQDIVFEGLVKDDISKNLQDELMEKAYRLLEQLENEVYMLLAQNQEKLIQLKEALLEKKILRHTDIQAILVGSTTPPTT